MPMKPHEFLEAFRTLRAFWMANPLPSAEDRKMIGDAFNTQISIYEKETIAEQRRARGEPVSAPIIHFRSARELWEAANLRDEE